MRSALAGLVLLSLTGTGKPADDACVRYIVAPGYPRLARMARLQGSVTVEVKVAEDGRVLSAKGIGAHNLLIRASEENVAHWIFDTGLDKNGASIKRTVIYVYRLEGKEQYYDSMPLVVFDLPGHVEITAHPPEPQP